MRTFKEHNIDPSTNLEYHSKNDIPLNENVFRVGSKAYYELFQEARKQMEEGKYTPEGVDKFLLEETDIGEYGLYEGQFVPIDCPLMEAEYKGKEVELNEPKRGGDKKFYVYVKNDKGNVIKIQFGDTQASKQRLMIQRQGRALQLATNVIRKKIRLKQAIGPAVFHIMQSSLVFREEETSFGKTISG